MNSSNENSSLHGRAPAPVTFGQLSAVCTLLLVFLASGCHNAGRGVSEIKLTLMDQTWVDKEYQRRLNEQVAEFTRQTGIRVEVLPAPEAALEQLATWRRLLESGAKVPDVYSIDVIWPGILADNLIDPRKGIQSCGATIASAVPADAGGARQRAYTDCAGASRHTAAKLPRFAASVHSAETKLATNVE